MYVGVSRTKISNKKKTTISSKERVAKKKKTIFNCIYSYTYLIWIISPELVYRDYGVVLDDIPSSPTYWIFKKKYY